MADSAVSVGSVQCRLSREQSRGSFRNRANGRAATLSPGNLFPSADRRSCQSAHEFGEIATLALAEPLTAAALGAVMLGERPGALALGSVALDLAGLGPVAISTRPLPTDARAVVSPAAPLHRTTTVETLLTRSGPFKPEGQPERAPRPWSRPHRRSAEDGA